MKLKFQFNELTELANGIGLYVFKWCMVSGRGLEYLPTSPSAYSAWYKKL